MKKCPEGFFCMQGQVDPFECTDLSDCPEGSTEADNRVRSYLSGYSFLHNALGSLDSAGFSYCFHVHLLHNSVCLFYLFWRHFILEASIFLCVASRKIE